MKIDSFLLPLAASKALNETQAVSDTDLLVVNTLQAGYWDALVVDTLTDKLHQVKFEHSYPSVEDSCVLQFRGSYYVLGGFYRPRLIAKIEDCGIREQAEELSVPHVNGMQGSCTVYEDAVQLCFYSGDRDKCASWTPESGAVPLIGTAAHPHNFGEMITFQNEMYVVGGCDDSYQNCNSKVEIYNSTNNAWVEGASPPLTDFYGMALTADETSIYAFGGRRDHSSAPNQVLEYRYGKWKILGSMVENHRKLNSAFQIGNIVYSGYCGLEKNVISDNGVQSKSLYDPSRCLELYYAIMMPMPAGSCK